MNEKSCAPVEVVASQIKDIQEDVRPLKGLPEELGRHDERILIHSDTLKRYGTRIESLEADVTRNSGVSRMIERGFWIVVAAMVGYAAKTWG